MMQIAGRNKGKRLYVSYHYDFSMVEASAQSDQTLKYLPTSQGLDPS